MNPGSELYVPETEFTTLLTQDVDRSLTGFEYAVDHPFFTRFESDDFSGDFGLAGSVSDSFDPPDFL